VDSAELISSIAFELVQPDAARRPSLRFPLERRDRPAAELLELPGAPIDVFNALLPEAAETPPSLRGLCGIPRMSTYAAAAFINHAVRRLPPDQAYLNIGVYAGFSFLAGMLDNPERPCIGVDNFSRPRARAGLLQRFDEMKGPAHRFHEMDYLDYFDDVHSEQLGVYFYDGDHAYEHQLKGLTRAERYFADGCIVIVDDTNWVEPRQATIDFVAASEREYEVLLDCPTRDHNHPTYWNGLMILRVTDRARPASTAEIAERFTRREHRPTKPAFNVEPASGEDERPADTPLVSIVLLNDGEDVAALEAATEACRAQTWPRTELVVFDRHDGAPLANALELTTGELVGFTDTAAPLRPTAVELAVRLPPGSRFFTSFGDVRYAEHERELLGR
jgi:predicted O-methyltransferase YrrM